ncbi:cysteine--tRNA ligase [Alkalispirochaeta sphaeroplastigenens]|uniref:Cysteine--tRNA ligase n=1 Tax=Alkalispirochaeta sphaeroplastigenens TaxID=1187066 RepID=A0A2S4JGP0_9SPIO|nr:cysteine--tRNA ligase [Alkalispirochaeta sphaeroplastigenens]POQ98727.1 cysteine--tRNA ligase [Alkalispirochaeta sphaeroplastigenens]
MADQPLYEQIGLTVFNSLSRSREPFRAITPPHVGMYVCGPTVYSDPHLGHARAALAFDTVFRYLRFLGYQVRYVRNITDVGHLEDEAAEAGEDKILKRARLERLEPMEVVQRYTLLYREGISSLGCLPPSIEPAASGHIVEQIQVIERILAAGLAYEQDGSVYFDLNRYVSQGKTLQGSPYGTLSGKVFEDLLENTRNTSGREEKRNALDFALWKRAEPGHIMRWPSPWGEGFPGWHLECTAMSTRYLGETFDIHGGGLDLQFPHHEAEIAQSHGAFGEDPARYWLHSNMLTVGGQKMAKSLGNFITLEEIFSGDHPALDRAWDPMVVRFFMLQSHYRSTIDFSGQALAAAEKGYTRLMAAVQEAERYLADHSGEEATPRAASLDDIALRRSAAPREDSLAVSGRTVPAPGDRAFAGGDDHARAVADRIEECWRAMSDDFHTPRTIATLFDLGRLTQGEAHLQATPEVRAAAARTLVAFSRDVLGLRPPAAAGGAASDDAPLEAALELLMEIRRKAREEKDFARADAIRDRLGAAGIQLKDGKDGTTGWTRT